MLLTIGSLGLIVATSNAGAGGDHAQDWQYTTRLVMATLTQE